MEAEIRTMVGLEKGIEIGVVQVKVPNPEVEINLIGIRIEMTTGHRVEIIPETDLHQGQDQAPIQAQTGTYAGAIDELSKITLQGNALT